MLIVKNISGSFLKFMIDKRVSKKASKSLKEQREGRVLFYKTLTNALQGARLVFDQVLLGHLFSNRPEMSMFKACGIFESVA